MRKVKEAKETIFFNSTGNGTKIGWSGRSAVDADEAERFAKELLRYVRRIRECRRNMTRD